MTAWDLRALVRGAGLAGALLVASLAVTALSDEGGVALGVRLGRALPTAPLCAAVAAWLAMRGPRARGETLALETLGRSPLGVVASAVGGAVAVALVAAGAIGASPRVDVSGFYPRLEAAEAFTWDGTGFVDGAGSVRVAPDGRVSRRKATSSAAAAFPPNEGGPPGGRAAAALATALAALALALVAAAPRDAWARRVGDRGGTDAAACGACAALVIVAFHAAAAGRAPPFVAVGPPAALLAWALFRYKARRWMTGQGRS